MIWPHSWGSAQQGGKKCRFPSRFFIKKISEFESKRIVMDLNLTNLLASDPVNTNLIITAERSAAFLPSPLRESSYQKILEFESKRIVMNPNLTNLRLIQQAQISVSAAHYSVPAKQRDMVEILPS